MKNFPIALLIILFSTTVIISCTKLDLNSPSSESQSLSSAGMIKPNVPDCGSGNHWSFYLGKCVADCPSGYHNDSITGACVGNGGGTTNIAVITNSNNPYDYLGNQHNNGVSNIIPTINFSSNNLDSVVLVKVKYYVVSIGYNADSMQNFYSRAVQTGYFPFSHLQELDSLGNTLYANGLLSSYGNGYVQQIYNYANQYLNTDTITVTKYNSFANSLVALEATIKNDGRISSWEKQVVLSGCSIGRYSASYWGNYFNGNGGGTPPAVRPLLLQKLKRWLKVVISDMAGGIVGISGGPVGIVGGAIGGSILADATLP